MDTIAAIKIAIPILVVLDVLEEDARNAIVDNL